MLMIAMIIMRIIKITVQTKWFDFRCAHLGGMALVVESG